MTAITDDTDLEPCQDVACSHPEHTLPMATLTALMAEALTGSHLVDGHLVKLAAEVGDGGHLVAEAVRVRFDEATDVAVRVVLHVSAADPITTPQAPAIEGDDELLSCGCYVGYCYCEAGHDDPEPSSACSRCGHLTCECAAEVATDEAV
jgi:hypothetical protein